MAQFAVDTFTGTSGTELATYSANWVKASYSGSSDWVLSDANRARCGGSNSTYYNTGTPASADYTVKVDVYIASDAAATPGVCGRLDTSAQTYYHARAVRVNSTTLNWELYKRVVGTFTQLGSSVSQTITTGSSYELKLSMVGTTIELYDEGSGSATISATDSAITAAGYSGLRENNTSTNSSRYHFDNFSADDVSAGTTYTITPSGGVVIGGTSVDIKGKVLAVSGGITLAGTGSMTFTSGGTTYTITPSGGVTMGGSATYIQSKTFSPSGGITLGGTSDMVKTKIIAPTDGVILGGTGSMSSNTVVVTGTVGERTRVGAGT